MAVQGNTLNVTQDTQRAVIDWTSFSIGAGNTVNVNNGGIYNSTLARVTGNERSVIDGTLTATSHFYLVNPQGVLIGKNGVVTTGGRFIASTLDTDNDHFMNGDTPLFAGTGNGTVVNMGKISSSGGNVYLISRTLAENDGTISAPNGTVDLAVGDSVQLKDPLLIYDPVVTPQTFVSTTGSHGDAVNKGTIEAARIALQAADGNVYALAGNSSALRATGIAGLDGRVWLVAPRGTTHVHGALTARDVSGGGGTVATQGATLHLDDADVRAGQWNLSALQLDVGPKTAAILERNLNNGTSIDADATRDDIHLTSNLRWSGNGALTVGASRSVFVDPGITVANTGAGSLTLRADSSGIGNGGGVVNRGTLDWSKSAGTVAVLRDVNGAYTAGTILLNPMWSAAPYSGLKTQLTAYQLVNTIVDLQNISNDMAGNYSLGRDLGSYFVGTAFYALGGATRTPFTGQFDGQNHVLTYFQIHGYGTDSKARDAYTGLFAEIGEGGVVRNLGLLDVTATTIASPVGLITGRNAGLIEHVHASGGGAGSEDPLFAVGGGGIAGINDGVIERSWSNASVRGAGALGGIAGINNGRIAQSYTQASLNGAASTEAGGIAGVNRGTVSQTWSQSNINGLYAGGLVAINEGTIEQSYANNGAEATGARHTGSIASVNNGSIANDVYWTTSPFVLPIPGVYSGTPVPDSNGRTSDQMRVAANYGRTWDFSPAGAWFVPAMGTAYPILRWQLGEPSNY